VLALLAFACVPALAQAECTDSSCKQYEVEIPTSGGKEHKPQHSNSGGGTEPTANASTPNKPKSGGGGSENPETRPENEAEEKQAGVAGGGGGNGGNGPANNGGSPGGNGSNQAQTGLEGEKSLGSGTTPGQNASHSSGGSSPLVPILIAIAVLAAISIGAVIYRQRRQDSGGSGSPVSPKAG
jgi:hypothetical protein